MTTTLCPLMDSPFNHISWPNHGCVALVLDGCAIPDIGSTIYEWSAGQVNAECLYATTSLEAVSDLSPWLVWISSVNDAVLQRFLKDGAAREQGYLIFSDSTQPELTHWMRALLQIERVPGYPEVLRIAHPELARSILGNSLVQHTPAPAVQRILSPDRTTGQWVCQALTPSALPENHPEGRPYYSEGLDSAFFAFNRRRDNLLLWDSLGSDQRRWLGGPELPEAYLRLSTLVTQADQEGCHSLRDRLRYLTSLQARETGKLAPADTSPAATH